MASGIQISVVIPVYKSADCLPELMQRLTDVLKPMGKPYEILLVNDCSPDNSWDVMVGLCDEYSSLKAISLRKNFGQDSALMAGLSRSLGEEIIIMDDDLQHDPVDIPALLAEMEKGYDVCYAKFDTKKQTWFKNFGSWVNDKAANIVLRKPSHVYMSPYKALKRQVVMELLRYDGPYPYVDGLLFRVTQNITQIMVRHHERYSGRGNYNLIRSLAVWSKLATNFSVLPLRIATVLGFIVSAIGLLLAAYFAVRRIALGLGPAGWASQIVAILFLGGVQLISVGVIGEYVGRMFLYQNREPQFVISDTKLGRDKNT